VGLLAAMVLVLRGCEVYGLDVVDANTARPKCLSGIGGRHMKGSSIISVSGHIVYSPVCRLPSTLFSLKFRS
jgi:hypothetical protein